MSAQTSPVFRDVIDEMNSIIARERARKLRLALAAAPYQVHYGPCLAHTQHFSTFDGALEFVVDHVDDEFCPRLVHASFDDERSGLSDEESEIALAAYEMRSPKARRA